MTSFIQLSDEDPSLDLIAGLAPLRTDRDQFEQSAASALQEGRFAALADLVLAEQEALWKRNDKETESIFILLSALLPNVESEEDVNRIIKRIAEVVTAGKSSVPLRLKILSNLFNTIHSRSAALYDVFTALVKFTAETNTVNVIIPHLRNVENWVSDWSLDLNQKRELYVLLSTVLQGAGKHKHAYDCLVRYLSTFEDATESELAAVADKAAEAAMEAIRVSDFTQCDVLMELKAVRQLKDHPNHSRLHQLLQIFIYDNVESFSEWYKANTEYLTQLGLNYEDCMEKMRLLSLCSLGADNARVPYALVASTLHISETEVEKWIVKAVTLNVIDAKMDQLQQVITFDRVTQRCISDAQWRSASAKIKQWKQSLTAMLDSVKSTRHTTEIQVANMRM